MKSKEIQLFSAFNVRWFSRFLFLDHCLHTHTCTPVAYDARFGLYAFQSAGGRTVLTVDFLCSQSVCFIFLPLYPCLPCVFFFWLFKPGGQFKHKHITSIEMEKRNNNNVQKDRKRIWSIVLQINFVLYLLCIMTLFKKKCTFSKTVN